MVYDENFRRLLESLYSCTGDDGIDGFLERLYGRKKDEKDENGGKKRANENMIYYDFEEEQPLMGGTGNIDDLD